MGKIRIFGLVCREQRLDHSEDLRLGCGSVVGNVGSEMLVKETTIGTYMASS